MEIATLILLTYNQENFVEQSVRSALKQDYYPLRIIISDDASSDSTAAITQDIIHSYKGNHEVVFQRNLSNLGFVDHFNKVVKSVNSRYIVYAAGDDISYPNRASALIQALSTTKAMLAHSDVNLIDFAGKPVVPYVRSGKIAQEILMNSTRAAASMSLHIGASAAFDKQLFEKYGPISEGCLEDLILGYRASLENSVVYIPRPLLKYRIGNGISQLNEWQGSVDKWKLVRLQILHRERYVLEQRISDNLKHYCGIDNSLEKKILCKEVAERRVRINAITMKKIKYFYTHKSSPLQAIKVLCSEKVRQRKVKNVSNRTRVQANS